MVVNKFFRFFIFSLNIIQTKPFIKTIVKQNLNTFVNCSNSMHWLCWTSSWSWWQRLDSTNHEWIARRKIDIILSKRGEVLSATWIDYIFRSYHSCWFFTGLRVSDVSASFWWWSRLFCVGTCAGCCCGEMVWLSQLRGRLCCFWCSMHNRRN